MRINELCESIDLELEKNGNKHGLDFDLKDDLLFYMNHNDNAYRRHTYPAIMDCSDMLESGKQTNPSLFKNAVKQAYNSYCNEFQIRELPDDIDQELLDEVSKHIYDDECEKIKDGHYKRK